MKPSDGYSRVLTAVQAALAENRQVGDDWRLAVSDAVLDLDWIVTRRAHPDDVARARIAVSSLAGIWFTEDEVDAIFTGEDPS